MLSIKEVSVSSGKAIKMMITVDGTEDIILLAQILSPMAKHILLVESGDNADKVFNDVIEYGKGQLRLHGTAPVFMALVIRICIDGWHECDGIFVSFFKAADNRDFLETEAWKVCFDESGKPYV